VTKNDFKKLLSLEEKLLKTISTILDNFEEVKDRIAFKILERDKHEVVVMCYLDNEQEITQKKLFFTVEELFGN
jgi:hypothetical protein